MGTPTQTAGLASETLALQATNGFLGWSPDADRSPYTVRGGWDGSAVTAYADSTAYAVGKAVTYNGATYVARSAIGAGNTTKPDVNAGFGALDNKKGLAEVSSPTTRKAQFFR